MNSSKDSSVSDDLFGMDGDTAANDVTQNDAVTAAANVQKAPAGEKPVTSPVKPPVLPKYQPQKKENDLLTVQPVLRNNPHFLHRKRKSEEFSPEEKQEVSHILKEARNRAGLSPEEVEELTLIRTHYLIALEEADYDNLPRPVFVLAYLRKLCRLYDIPADVEMQLVKPWRNIPCELPENLSKSVQMDPEKPNQKVLHLLEIAILAFGALIVTGIVVLAVVWAVSFFSGKYVPDLTFENSSLLELQPKPQLQMPENN